MVDELLVVTAVLSDFVGAPDATGVIMLYEHLEARTADFPDSAAWTAATDGFGLRRVRYRSLVSRYWTANRQSRRLAEPLEIPGWRVQLVDDPTSSISAIAETVHYISRVGLNQGRDSALVAVDAICGALCGHGILALYVRRDDGWTLASTLQRLQY